VKSINPAEKPKVFALGIALTIGAIALLNSWGKVDSPFQSIKIDGSSTVYPITDAMAK
jgi:phosphate transport system substrate-binding protein